MTHLPLPFLLQLLVSLSLPRHSLGFPQRSPLPPSSSFSFPRFSSPDPSLTLHGPAEVSESAVRLTTSSFSRFSSAVYAYSIDFGRRPSFSSELSFSISPDNGNGFAFFLAPSNADPEALAAEPFGVSPGVFAVEFDTRMDLGLRDPNANHVGVDVGRAVSLATGNASAVGVKLNCGGKLRAWIDFDGGTSVLEVRLGKDGVKARPLDALVSYPVDLSGVIWREAMSVGICTYGGANDSQIVTMYSWKFGVKHAGPYLMHSEPLNPLAIARPREGVVDGKKKGYYLPDFLLAMAIGAACGAALAMLIVSLWSFEMERHPVAPIESGIRSGEGAAVRDKGKVKGSK